MAGVDGGGARGAELPAGCSCPGAAAAEAVELLSGAGGAGVLLVARLALLNPKPQTLSAEGAKHSSSLPAQTPSSLAVLAMATLYTIVVLTMVRLIGTVRA